MFLRYSSFNFMINIFPTFPFLLFHPHYRISFFVIINSYPFCEALQLSKYFHAHYLINRTRFIYLDKSFVLSRENYLSGDLPSNILKAWAT